MKCFECKKEIKDESKMILLDSDGDFVCDETCKIIFEKNRQAFFDNIGSDEWYEKNYFKL